MGPIMNSASCSLAGDSDSSFSLCGKFVALHFFCFHIFCIFSDQSMAFTGAWGAFGLKYDNLLVSSSSSFSSSSHTLLWHDLHGRKTKMGKIFISI